MARKSGWVTIGKLGATSLHWQLGKHGVYKDLKFNLIKVISDPNVCKNSPHICNDMENQTMSKKRHNDNLHQWYSIGNHEIV